MTDFETSDLALAAFLVARGHALNDVRGAQGGRRVFYFTREVQGDARAFYTGEVVGARAYANALRDLKTLIRER